MIKFLLDANLSPLSAQFLRNLGHDVLSLIESKQHHLKDPEVVRLAIEQERIILTFDQDFGEMYYHQQSGSFGVIVLRIHNQTVESVNRALQQFLSQYQHKLMQNPKSLLIIKPHSVRFVTV